MSASAPPIGISSVAVISQGNSASSSSSSSPNKYDPVRMGSEDCIRRIKQTAKVISAQIPPKNNGDKFNCGVTLETMKEPTLIGPCGHTFDRLSTLGIVASPVTKCPNCRTNIQSRSPNLQIKTLIDEWQQEDRIPTLASFKEADGEEANFYLQMAGHAEKKGKYDAALTAYTQAFIYTKKSDAYAAIPQLYLKLGQKEQAVLAYLHLAMYQLQEGKVLAAIESLKSADEISPNPLKINALLVCLDLDTNPSQEQINEAILIASTQKDPEDAIAIYKHVIAINPRQLDVYMALSPLLKDPAERNHLLLKASRLAELEGNLELALKLRTETEAKMPVYPTSISKEDWINPVAFLAKLPPKPQALQDYLAAPCPIFGGAEGKTRAETHIVVARPKDIIINGAPVPFTLSTLDKLDKESRGIGCRYIWDEILKAENNLDTPPEIEFEWLVMTKDVLPGSRHKDYAFQRNLAETKGYSVPGFRDAATCILWENRNSGTRFYNDNPWTYTRCHEMLQGYHLVVGGFAPGGLGVSNRYDVPEYIGVAGLRKF